MAPKLRWPLWLALWPAALAAQSGRYPGPAMWRDSLAPGVWAIGFDNSLGNEANVDGNSLVIVNRRDVVVVDAQWTPTTTRRVIAEIRKLTRLPVRYVVTTHWHGDHWFGNQAYLDAFPGVEFIAHPNTLADLEAEEIRDIEPTWKTRLPEMITDLRGYLARGTRRNGTPLTAADRTQIERQIAAMQWGIPALREVHPVRPTILVADSLILRRDNRTIVIRHPGRGNTRGDLVVWLPVERVLATGDLLVKPAPYSFGSYLGEWIATLGQLRALGAGAVMPGHGRVDRDWAYLDLVMELLRTTLDQARAAAAKGLDLEGFRRALDLAALRARFTGGDERIGRAFDAFFITPAPERAWLEVRGELDRPVRK